MQQAQEAAQEVTAKWLNGRDPVADWEGNSDWGDVDPTVMAVLEGFHDAAIGTINAAWRAAAGRLPACTGNSRKDCWSKEYGEQARQLKYKSNLQVQTRRDATDLLVQTR